MKTMKQFLEEQKTKIDIVPTPGQGQGQQDTINNPASPAEKAFKDKHVIQKTDYPVKMDKSGSNHAVYSGAKQTRKKRIADNDEETAAMAYEAIDADEKENIVKGMKKNKSDFVARYGKDAESVMHGAATNMAKESFELADGSLVEIDVETLDKVSELYDALTPENQKAFMGRFSENRMSNSNVLEWIRSI